MNTAQLTFDTASSLSSAARVSYLRARFENVSGQTQIQSKYHNAPIKIAKTFPLGGPVGVIVMDASPGLLAGDRYEFAWHAGKEAHIYVTNQSFTKVHPCTEDANGASICQTEEA